METLPHTPQQTLCILEPTEKDLLIWNMTEELKKLIGKVHSNEGWEGCWWFIQADYYFWSLQVVYVEGCIHLNIELSEGYKPSKFDMFDGTIDPKVHLKTYCDKLVGVLRMNKST